MPNDGARHKVNDEGPDRPKERTDLMRPLRQQDEEVGEAREDVCGEQTSRQPAARGGAHIEQAGDQKERDVLDVVRMHASRALDVLVWQQLVRAGIWVRQGFHGVQSRREVGNS